MVSSGTKVGRGRRDGFVAELVWTGQGRRNRLVEWRAHRGDPAAALVKETGNPAGRVADLDP